MLQEDEEEGKKEWDWQMGPTSTSAFLPHVMPTHHLQVGPIVNTAVKTRLDENLRHMLLVIPRLVLT